MTSQLLQVINRGVQGGLSDDANQHARSSHFVNRALRAFRTAIARVKRFVRHVDLFGTLISVGGIAPVPLFRRRVHFVAVVGFVLLR